GVGDPAAPPGPPVAPPTIGWDSTTRTRAPCLAALSAAISPAPPEPTTATSTSSGIPSCDTVPMEAVCWVGALVTIPSVRVASLLPLQVRPLAPGSCAMRDQSDVVRGSLVLGYPFPRRSTIKPGSDVVRET